MIPDDFVESYIRLENNIVTNEEAITFDREGNVIFTTPYLDVGRIVSDNLRDVGQNIQPENTNIIIDSVVLLSTNPNCENYLPLKLQLGKRQVEFSTTQRTELTDYKVIADPSVNLSTVENRKYDGETRNYSIGGVNVPLYDDIVVSNNTAYITDGSSDVNILNLDTNLQSIVTTPTPVLSLYANESQSIARIDDADNIVYWDLSTTPYGEVVNISDAGHIDTFLVDNALYVFYVEDGRTDTTLTIWNVGDDVGLPNQKEYVLTFSAYVFDFIATRVGLYNKAIFYGYNQLGSNMVGIELINGGFEKIYDFTFNVVGTVIKLGVGGSDLNNPIITLAVISPILSIFRVDSIGKLISFKTYQAPINGLIKRYRNQFYYYQSGTQFRLLNLDTGDSKIYDVDNMNPLKTYPRNYEIVNINADRFIAGGADDFSNLSLVSFANSRPLNKVYKLSYNYDERPFPYQLSSNRLVFRLSLPNNNPISDMEIFKYVIDLRIRFSKKRAEPNPITRNTRTKGDGRAVGDVREVLGLVDEDTFDLQQFLGMS